MSPLPPAPVIAGPVERENERGAAIAWRRRTAVMAVLGAGRPGSAGGSHSLAMTWQPNVAIVSASARLVCRVTACSLRSLLGGQSGWAGASC